MLFYDVRCIRFLAFQFFYNHLKSYLLLVVDDKLLGVQEIVVKPVPKYIKKMMKTTGVSGCTLLGDGSISLILDPQLLNKMIYA